MVNIGPVSGKLLVILVLITLVAAAGVAYYLYHTEEEKKRLELEQHRESVRAAYAANLTSADLAYTSVEQYGQPPNRNNTEKFYAWLDGYGQRLSNYSAAINCTRVAGADYQQLFGNESEDYAWVDQNSTRLNRSFAGLAGQYDQYKADYAATLAAKEQAKQAYVTASDRASAIYTRTHDNLFLEDYQNYPSLGAYLNSCSRNITLYKDSINETRSAGTAYQAYLMSDSQEYDDILTRIDGLNRDAATLDKKYVGQQGKIPSLTLTVGATDYDWSADMGLYEYVTFQVANNNYPMPVSNITAHFTLIDNQTGVVKDRTDVPVTIHVQVSAFHGAMLRIEDGHKYDLKWTLTYDY